MGLSQTNPSFQKAFMPMEPLQLYPLLDITSLNPADHPAGILAWKNRWLAIKERSNGLLMPASLCVFPEFLPCIDGFTKTVVTGNFPLGKMPQILKLTEIHYATAQGADEIDFVINRAPVFTGDWEILREEVAAARDAADEVILKVIIETGDLKQESYIRKVTRLLLEEDVDFVKTSTGKIFPGADLDVVTWISEEIYQYYQETGIRKGLKISGGIASIDQALHLLAPVRHVLGEAWLTPSLCRIGASKLADEIANGYFTENIPGKDSIES